MKAKRKAVWLIGILILVQFSGSAQKSVVLTIGDTLPLTKLIQALHANNYKHITRKDFEGKAIILDFWNIWCHACWGGMDKLNTLQQNFSNQVIFIKITANTRSEVAGLYKKLGKQPPAVLSITGDKTFGNLFPHMGDPLHVWIDQKRTVRHITYGYNATSEHVTAFLKGEPLSFTRRGDLGSVGQPRSWFQNACTTVTNEVQGYSILVSGQHEYSSIRSEKPGTKPFLKPTLVFTQTTRLDLFRSAYFHDLYGYRQPRFFAGNNRICLEVSDTSAFFQPSDSNRIDKWTKDHLFNYELCLPTTQKLDPLFVMQTDLLRYFPYRVAIETRKVPCLVLTWRNNGNKLLSKPEPPGTDYTFSVKEDSIQSLLSILAVAYQKDVRPLISDIALTEPVQSLFLTSELEDFHSLRKELQTYGLDIVEEVRLVKFLVIRDQ